VTKLRLWERQKHLKEKSNLNSVFKITTKKMRQSTQIKLWWSIQTLKVHYPTTQETKEKLN